MLTWTADGRLRHMPLMNSKREAAEMMEPLARRIQREAMHRSDRRIRMRESGAVADAKSDITHPPADYVPPTRD